MNNKSLWYYRTRVLAARSQRNYEIPDLKYCVRLEEVGGGDVKDEGWDDLFSKHS